MGLQFFARLRSSATDRRKTLRWLRSCAVVVPCLWTTTAAAEQSTRGGDDAGERTLYSARLSVLNGALRAASSRAQPRCAIADGACRSICRRATGARSGALVAGQRASRRQPGARW